MTLKQWLTTWSRKIHRWIGLYFTLIVTLYLIESLMLPAIFGEGLPTIDGTPTTHAAAANTATLLSRQEASQCFRSQQPQGLKSWEDITEITYLPQADLYRFANRDRYFE